MATQTLTLMQYLAATAALVGKTAAEAADLINAKTIKIVNPDLKARRFIWYDVRAMLAVMYPEDPTTADAIAKQLATAMDVAAAQDPAFKNDLQKFLAGDGIDMGLDFSQKMIQGVADRGLLPQSLADAVKAMGVTWTSVAEQNNWGTITAEQVTAARAILANTAKLRNRYAQAVALANAGQSWEAIAAVFNS